MFRKHSLQRPLCLRSLYRTSFSFLLVSFLSCFVSLSITATSYTENVAQGFWSVSRSSFISDFAESGWQWAQYTIAEQGKFSVTEVMCVRELSLITEQRAGEAETKSHTVSAIMVWEGMRTECRVIRCALRRLRKAFGSTTKRTDCVGERRQHRVKTMHRKKHGGRPQFCQTVSAQEDVVLERCNGK